MISIIIVNYNAGDYLGRCLRAVLQQSYQDFEIILVDNGSNDHSIDHLPQDDRIQIIQLNENLGFAAANNRAAAIAKGAWLALLNPDAFPKEDWLGQLVNATYRFPDFSLFGSTQINAENTDLLDGTGDMYHILGIPYRGNYQKPIANLPETGEVFAPCAAAALYKKEVFERAGGFDEAFFCYCEDIDLAFRLRLMGERCLQVKEAVVYHVGSGITGKSSDFARFYGIRNRFWVFFKNMPMPLLIILLFPHLWIQCMVCIIAFRRGYLAVFIRAWREICKSIPYLLNARKQVQQRRIVSLWQLTGAFTFSLRKLVNREV